MTLKEYNFMKSTYFSRKVDVLVMILVLIPLLISVFHLFFTWFGSTALIFPSSLYETIYLPIVAILTCFVLVLWLSICDGCNSKLWNWLPPFVFFKNLGISGRIFIVVALIVGTLVGLAGELFGIIDPM